MFIWGKCIGVFFGTIMFGNSMVGAILGYWVGNFFDENLKKIINQGRMNSNRGLNRPFIEATFLVMGHVAKADGRVSEAELHAARHAMDRLNLDSGLRQEAMSLFNRGKSPKFSIEVSLNELIRQCGHDTRLLQLFIELQIQAALADGHMHPAEKQILLSICQRLGFSAQAFEGLRGGSGWYQWDFNQNFRGQQQYQTSQASPQSASLQAYSTLGVAQTSEITEIKKAYRKLMNKHHPDKLQSQGASPERVKAAKEKTQTITAAYNLIRRERGFK